MDIPVVTEPISRILVVHNSYQQRGGEDCVVDAEIALLRSHGHEVETYRRHNNDVATMGAAVLATEAVWSRRTTVELSNKLDVFRPDVIHVHNTFPLISASLYWTAAKAGIPVVQSLHNFRLVCLQAMLLRDGRPCEDCVGRLPWRGVLRRCYRSSTRESAVVAAMLGAHRALGTYREKVSRYIALSEFSRRKLVQGGLPAERITVKPNFVDVSGSVEAKRVGGLFVGRLSQEKGLHVLLGALERCAGTVIRVVGAGPEAHTLDGHPYVRALGWREREETLKEYYSAEYLVLPSVCYENFPLALVEAFACKVPVIASRLGAMAELIEDGQTGLLFDPGSAVDLAAKIKWAEANRKHMREMGENARIVYESKYTPEKNYRQLIAIYAAALAESRQRD